MSLRDLIAADVADVFLQSDDFAEPVTRHARGKGTSDIAVTAIVDLPGTNRDSSSGESEMTSGSLLLASGIDVHRDDTWTIRGTDYQAVTIGPDDGHGMRTVSIQRIESLHRGSR